MQTKGGIPMYFSLQHYSISFCFGIYVFARKPAVRPCRLLTEVKLRCAFSGVLNKADV